MNPALRLDAARRAYAARPSYENLCRLEAAEANYARKVTT